MPASKLVTAPVVASNAATALRDVEPLTVVQAPPAYSVEPDSASVSTSR
jgi:hypothetical protein